MDGDDGAAFSEYEQVMQKVAQAPCPVCGSQTIRPLGELENLFVFVQMANAAGEILSRPGERGGHTAVPIACDRCGFLRLHMTAILQEKQGAPQE